LNRRKHAEYRLAPQRLRGSCACATCCCYVDEGRLAKLPPPDDNELAMLDLTAAGVRPDCRLSCQIKPSPAIEGLVVRLPETQR
jgi:ferredoxin, 2Fe-2S